MAKTHNYDYDMIAKKLNRNVEHVYEAEMKRVAREMAMFILKRKRNIEPSDEPSPNLRPQIRVKSERKMSEADLNAMEEATIKKRKEEANLERKNNRLTIFFNNTVDKFHNQNRNDLLKEIIPLFSEVVKERKGDRYLNETIPRINGRHTRANMSRYKVQLKKWFKTVLN
ncbi:TPA: hypothetical protein N0F65_010333 [Lagenidium giganteum]|uniref:Uncharacterized protein n=1 Tax=Lagenidium giganteum TaxID=4803 RepID=A0AAV2Z7R0_9STRA|nr:TPA: hypothetical protein N0F65_010333 [Lagenidium giganteum]